METMNCQSFRQGCCGCCVNMRWPAARLEAWLDGNTTVAERFLRLGVAPQLHDLIRWHWMRGGWRDHALAAWLAPLTLGASVWLWWRRFGSCCFAGYLDRESGRVGCLVHPERVGWPDARRFAFPLVPTLRCKRRLRCPMLDAAEKPGEEAGWLEVSRAGAASRRAGQRARQQPAS